MWRTLTGEEIIQLAKEYEALEVWKKIRPIILDTYGEQAYLIMLSDGEEFNDESIVDVITTFAVYDREGSRLGPNLSLPFWQEHLVEWQQHRHIMRARFGSEQDEDIWFLEVAEDIVRYALPACTGSFQLDTPPPISFPEVYANEPE